MISLIDNSEENNDYQSSQLIINSLDNSNEDFKSKANKIIEKFGQEDPFEDWEFYGNKALYISKDSSPFDVYEWRRIKNMKDFYGENIK